MKSWINKNYKTIIIGAFLVPIITVAVVSISHVSMWYGLSNPITWALYLSIGIEIAALSALAAISADMGSKVYFPFSIVTLIQFIGNIFFAYTFINVDTQEFKDWVDLVSPIVSFMGVEPADFVGHKRFLAFLSGGMLPIISLSFLHMLVKFTQEEKLATNNVTEEVKEEVNKVDASVIVSEVSKIRLDDDDLIKLESILLKPRPDKEIVNTRFTKIEKEMEELLDEIDNIPPLKEDSKFILSEKDLDIFQEVLSNSPPPNEILKEAAKKYTEEKTKQREVLIEMMNNDQELGLYDEPFDNPLVMEPPTPPQNESEMVLTTNSDIIDSIPSDDEISDWDVTLMDGLENEESFLTEGELVNIIQEETTPEFEIPEQEGWTEELEKGLLEEQVPEPFATPEEVIEYKIDEPVVRENNETNLPVIENEEEKKNS